MSIPKAIFCWSGGKDSAYCLHKVLAEKQFDVKYLLTTINQDVKRISMHGIREALLDKQVEAIGIPLLKVGLTTASNETYEQQMAVTLQKAKTEGIEHVIFGDIFLEDLRVYRENNLSKIGMKAIFPLWKMNTTLLINDFISKKFKTILCCINDGFLKQEWIGKEIDASFLQQLPSHVDPCGENGEYHTFCYDGPIFKNEIPFIKKEIVYKPLNIKTTSDCSLPSNTQTNGFWFIDLIPKN